MPNTPPAMRGAILSRLLSLPDADADASLDATVSILEGLAEKANAIASPPTSTSSATEQQGHARASVPPMRRDAPDSSQPLPLWDSSNLSPASLTAEEAQLRAEWHVACRRISRIEDVPGADTYFRGYFGLKARAFQAFEAFKDLWNEVPYPTQSFYSDPGLEEMWRHTFAVPVRRNVSLAVWHFESRARNTPGMRLVRGENDDLDAASLPDGARNAYLDAVAALERDDVKGLPPPAGVLRKATEAGVPLVEVEEPFDFDLFYPFVPLFVPWERLTVAAFESRNEPEGGAAGALLASVEQQLQSTFSERVQYITVAQRAASLAFKDREINYIAKHTVVLNAGGGGDVPGPLLAIERQIPVAATPSFGTHPHALSFFGAVYEGVRQEMLDAIEAHPFFADDSSRFVTSANTTVASASPPSPSLPPWQEGMADSLLQLAPRGINPSSFRLYESLQMGLIPVYIWDGDRPWLPYHDPSLPVDGSKGGLWGKVAFLVHSKDFPAFLDALPEMVHGNGAWYAGMKASISSLRDSHFTYSGVAKQIYDLLRRPDGDASSSSSSSNPGLRCSVPAQRYTY
jgi:hypothetical protein